MNWRFRALVLVLGVSASAGCRTSDADGGQARAASGGPAAQSGAPGSGGNAPSRQQVVRMAMPAVAARGPGLARMRGEPARRVPAAAAQAAEWADRVQVLQVGSELRAHMRA